MTIGTSITPLLANGVVTLMYCVISVAALCNIPGVLLLASTLAAAAAAPAVVSFIHSP